MTSTTTPRGVRNRRSTSRREHLRRRRWRATPLLIITAVVAFAGVTVIAYSPTAQWLSALNQASVVKDYLPEVDHARPAAAVQLREAQRYNDALSAGAIVAANTNVPTGSGHSTDGSLDYWKMLTTGSGMMARIQIPSIHVDLPIYHGTSQATLLKGAGHLQGTSLPIGGKGTHAVITAHRGLAESVLFTHLDKLHDGDRFTITTFGRILTYRVIDTKVVEPQDTATLRQEPGKDLVTLVTCTPLGINSHRMLVTGERVTPTPASDLAAARSGPSAAGFPWFAVAYAMALVAIALYTRWAGLVVVVAEPGTVGPALAPAAASPGRWRRRSVAT
jgi:sortase A